MKNRLRLSTAALGTIAKFGSEREADIKKLNLFLCFE